MTPPGQKGTVMQLVLRLSGERPELIKTLSPDWNARLVKGATIIEARVDGDGYVLPSNVDFAPASLRIDVEEQGGGATNTGSATVICGRGGSPLKPYRVPRRQICDGPHAYFSVGECVVIRAAHHRDDVVTIATMFVREVKHNRFAIVTEEIWKGDPSDLPETYARFEAAVKAAVKKSHCYHCRCAHFISMPEVK